MRNCSPEKAAQLARAVTELLRTGVGWWCGTPISVSDYLRISLWPARRAAAVDPMRAMRAE